MRPRNSPYDQRAWLVPGELAWARVAHPHENRWDLGKFRPAILVGPASIVGRAWHIMGGTTNSHHANGTPRQPILDWEASGLHGPGHLWGRTVRIDTVDIGQHIGIATPTLFAQVLDLCGLAPVVRDKLMAQHQQVLRAHAEQLIQGGAA